MSELQQIKTRIFNESKIVEVLELLDCWGIETEQNGKLYVAGLPDGENKRSVQIKNNENLISHIRSRGIVGDIYDVISYIVFDADTNEKRQTCLSKSKYWICAKLGYIEFIDDFYKETSNEIKQKPKYNDWLKKLNKSSMQEITNEVKPLKLLQFFGTVPYLKWLEEGISIKTQKMFQVGVDVQSERITFPVHNKSGELIGIKGRYFGCNEKIEDKYKYLYIIPCNKSIEFFNLHRALPHIIEKKEVIVVEGAKTVMLLYQWGYKNIISIEGDSLSDYQIQILKDLGLDIKFIFAWDKDKSVEFVFNEVIRLKGRLKYAICDKENLLDDKDSPCDKGEFVWKYLYENNVYKIN